MIRSWTIDVIWHVLSILILAITFNTPHNFKMSVDRGILNFSCDIKSSKEYWYNPIMQIGKYLWCYITIMLWPWLMLLILEISGISFKCFETHGIGGYLADFTTAFGNKFTFEGVTVDTDYFINIAFEFVTVIKNIFIEYFIKGFVKNPAAMLSVIFTSAFVLREKDLPLFNRGEIADYVYCTPVVLIVIIVGNITSAMHDYSGYLTDVWIVNLFNSYAIIYLITSVLLRTIFFIPTFFGENKLANVKK